MRVDSVVSALKWPIRVSLGLMGLQLSRRPKVRPGGRDRCIITELVADYLCQRQQKFVVLDGGAREAFSEKRWQALTSEQLTLYGFEVDAGECDRLNETARQLGLAFHFYPFGLWWRKGTARFYHTEEPAASSFYIPNEELTKRWLYTRGRCLGDLLAVKNIVDVDVTAIESWQKENNALEIDFIKLNVQGSELEVLKGAGPSLDSVVGLQLEMSFRQTYLDAPLFSDIDMFLRDRDFTFFDFLAPNIVGSVDSPIKVDVPQAIGVFRWPSRQLFEGHFLYFRDPIAIAARGGDLNLFTPLKVLKLAAFAEMWGQVEYAFELIRWLTSNLRETGKEDEAKEVARILEVSVAKYEVVYRDVEGFV